MPTIDADAHVIESERTWDYVENTKFRPQLATPNGGGAQYWMIDGKAFRRGVNVDRGLSEADREMRDIDARLGHMDELNIDIQVLYPSLFLRPVTAKPEVEKAICRSYNQWLIDICSKGRGRLQWIATVPMIDMDDAVEEIRFAKANRACGLFSRGLVDDKRLSHSFFYPLFEAAEKAGLAFCVHASTGNFDWVELFEGESGFSRFKVPVLSAFHPSCTTEFRRSFPSSLRFYRSAGSMDSLYVPSRSAEDSSATIQTRRNIIRDNRVYVTCQTDDDLPYILKYSGEDNIVIGSDYGHNDTSAEIEALRKVRTQGEVEPRIIDKILYDNAKALYGLDKIKDKG